MPLNVVVDAEPLVKGLQAYARSVPFATSYAMNLTAKDAVTFMREDIHRIFTIRNNYEAMGITFSPAGYKPGPSYLNLTIGSRHDYMAAQVLGGIKTPKTGGHVGVPQVGKGRPRALPTTITRPSKWPKAIQGDGSNTFVGIPKGSRSKTYGVWRRVTKDAISGKVVRKGAKDSKRGLMLLYTLAPSVKIEPRWPMAQQVETIWNARWYTNAAKGVEYCVRKAYEKHGLTYKPGVRYRSYQDQAGRWHRIA